MKRLTVLTPSYYANYSHGYSYTTKILFNRINDKELELDYSNALSAAYSSMIEGTNTNVEKYLKYKIENAKIDKDAIKHIDNIFKAYKFAQKKEINKENILKAHAIAFAKSLPAIERGKFRKQEIFVKNEKGKVFYKPYEPENIEDLINRLIRDIKLLFSRDLRLNQIFYYASFIHAAFIHISPFTKGNGIMARLLEKWYISKEFGENAWHIKSEEFYYHKRSLYFTNLALIGQSHFSLDYKQASEFSLMLSKSMEVEIED